MSNTDYNNNVGSKSWVLHYDAAVLL